MTVTLAPVSEIGVPICDAVTVSCSDTARTARLTSRSVRPASTRTAGASMPGAEARRVTVPAGTSSEKRPSAPVVTVTGAARGPETVTEAPATGWPSGPSTRPPRGSAQADADSRASARAPSAWRASRTPK